MRFTKERPTQIGTQFVAVWEYNSKLWSDVYKIAEEGLYEFDEVCFEFNRIEEIQVCWITEDYPVKFVIMEK